METTIKKYNNNKATFLVFEDNSVVNLAHVSIITTAEILQTSPEETTIFYFKLLVSGQWIKYTKSIFKDLTINELAYEFELFKIEREQLVREWISLSLPKGVEMETQTLKLH